jgi:hypothetical protein
MENVLKGLARLCGKPKPILRQEETYVKVSKERGGYPCPACTDSYPSTVNVAFIMLLMSV